MAKGTWKKKEGTISEITPMFKNLPTLTKKQYAAMKARCDGCSKTESYKLSYSAEKMGEATIRNEAWKLFNNPKMVAWLDWMRAEAGEEAACTYDSHLGSLKDIRDKAIVSKQFGPAVTAERTRGQAAGLHNHTRKVVTADLTGLYTRIAAPRAVVPAIEITNIDIDLEAIDDGDGPLELINS